MKVIKRDSCGWKRSGTGMLKVLVSEENSGVQNAMMGIAKLEPGARIPEGEGDGSHPVEELSYVISGSIRVRVEGQERLLDAGDSLVVYPGERHSVVNTGEVPAEIIWVLAAPQSI